MTKFLARPKVGFLILSQSNTRSFASLVARLSEHHNFVAYSAIEEKLDGIGVTTQLPVLPKPIISWLNFIESCYLWKTRLRSPNHYVRASSLFGTKKQFAKTFSAIPDLKRTNSFKASIVRICGTIILFNIINSLTQKILIPILFINYRAYLLSLDLLLVPHNAHLNYGFNFFIGLARALKIPTIALQENWDGLATKSFIRKEPNYFAVWGEQSLGHLRTIQYLKSTIPYVVGSPRFRGFGKISRPRWEKGQILVAGTSSILEDMQLLTSLLSQLPKSTILHYRPHPNKDIPDNVRQELLETARKSGTGLIISNEEDSYKSILRSNFVITLFSTLALEALCYGIPAIVPLFSRAELVNYTYEDMYLEWQHMQGLGAVSHAYFCRTPKEMQATVTELLKFDKRVSLELATRQTNWFCKGANYEDEILQLIDTVIGKQLG